MNRDEVTENGNILLSVIIPVYKAEAYLRDATTPLLEAGDERLELILVNDASPDGSAELMEKMAAEDGRVRCLHLEKNSRQGAARNRGLSVARGKYILFVDSDDILKGEALRPLLERMEACGAEVCAFGYLRMRVDAAGKKQIYDDGNQESLHLLPLGAKGNLDESDRAELFLHTAGVWNNIYRRDFLEKHDLRFPEGLSYEDNYFVKLCMLYVEKYSYIDERYYLYRETEGSTTQDVDSPRQFDRLEIEELKLKAFEERGVAKRYREAIDFDFVRLYYLNSLGLFLRRREIPYALLREMRRRVLPVWERVKRGPYYKYFRREERLKMVLSRLSFRLLAGIYRRRNS